MPALMILVAGPYRSGTGDDPELIARNVDAMTETSLQLFRAGHLPVMGEWYALPLIEHAGSTRIGDAAFDEIFHPVSRRLVAACDACLRIGGPSAGADEMVTLARAHGRAVYHSIDDVPPADSLAAPHIEHLALWTTDIDRCTRFYRAYFGATAGAPYRNERKGFESRFLTFASGARLEVMTTTTLHPTSCEPGAQRMGLTHFAITLGSASAVDALAVRLRADGVPVLDGPRQTGDGYYECVVLDPDGTRVEISA